MTIKRDETDIAHGLWGTPMPIDSGKHDIAVSAPNHQEWRKTIAVVGDGAKVSVEVPGLLPMQGAEPAAQVEQKPGPAGTELRAAPTTQLVSAPSSSRKTWAVVTAGLGVVGLGVGTAMVVIAEKKRSEADPYCNSNSNSNGDCNNVIGTMPSLLRRSSAIGRTSPLVSGSSDWG